MNNCPVPPKFIKRDARKAVQQSKVKISCRPRQNRSTEILDSSIRQRVAQITQQLVG